MKERPILQLFHLVEIDGSNLLRKLDLRNDLLKLPVKRNYQIYELEILTL